MAKVLFVCLGNICRSPTAEALVKARVDREGLSQAIAVDSAGTASYHQGSPADARARQAAAARGYDMEALRARQVTPGDFEAFDYILAMDRDNHADLLAQCPHAHRGKVRLFMDYHPDPAVQEVADPYFGGSQGFDRVLDQVEAAAEGLLDTLKPGR